jgi:hypothetical protein
MTIYFTGTGIQSVEIVRECCYSYQNPLRNNRGVGGRDMIK